MECSITMQSSAAAELRSASPHSSLGPALRPGCCPAGQTKTHIHTRFNGSHGGGKSICTNRRARVDLESGPSFLEADAEALDFPTYNSHWLFTPMSSPDLQMLGLTEIKAFNTQPGVYSGFLSLGDENCITCNFSTTLQSDPPKVEKQDSKQLNDYYVNTGYAIRTLRDELPVLFYKEMNYDIYRDDIVFRDPYNTFGGIHRYKLIFWSLRFYGRILFKDLWMEISRIWQPSDCVIMVRWTAHGITRLPWEARGQFDGISEYKLDKEGKIYEHKVDNVLLSKPTKSNALTATHLASLIGCHANPTPSLCQNLGNFHWMGLLLLAHCTFSSKLSSFEEVVDEKTEKACGNCQQEQVHHLKLQIQDRGDVCGCLPVLSA